MGRHLTVEDRYHIQAKREVGHTLERIARKLRVDKSTISRELRRNCGERGYRPKQAQRKSDERWRNAAKAIKMTPKLERYVASRIRLDWSPEQICGRLKLEGKASVSHERIYQFIGEDKDSGGDLWKHLRWGHRKRRKRYGGRDSRGEIPGRVSIEKRGRKANKRKKIGHLERDLVLGNGQQGALLTVVDRKSRMTFAARVESKSAKVIHRATLAVLRPVRDLVKTITNDNGTEFAAHKKTAKRLNVKIYFSHPYSSYERGTNENTNGLLRQYFPKKGTNFKKVKNRKVRFAVNRLNSRPRKCIGFQTPIEVLRKRLRKLKKVAFVI
ncbi:MAG: IS30 family transposase [Candidatus Omnitrophica bacterium]|nr:IS30 family transposase [Candidatus Omnitrophota bacterium]